MVSVNITLAKNIYRKIETKDCTLAELCFVNGLDYVKQRTKIEACINYLCELGFLIYENETKNNMWYGLLHSPVNDRLYIKHLT